MRQKLRWLPLVLIPLCPTSRTERAVASPTGTVAGTVTVKKPGGGTADPSGVVVYLEMVPGALPPPERMPRPQVRQRDLQFVPALTVALAGATVEFPNDDKVFHNVFSLSETAKFDLGLYKSGTSKSVTMRRQGVVSVYCNIHPEMIGKIKVLDTSFYAVVTEKGSFRIQHVPPGSYPLVAWQAYGPESRTQVTVSGDSTASVSIELTAGEPETQHLRKDGTPYGRYK
jgi:hypothetical protein